MMRAIRHSARINFTIEEETWQAICNNADKLTMCPTSRLRDELFKDLYSGAAADWFELAIDSGIFFSLFSIYKQILFSPHAKNTSAREQIGKILRVIDRLNLLQTNQNKSKPSQSFILALSLIPWAEEKYGLTRQQLKGHAIFHFSKKLREDLDRNIGPQLNLRRSIRQEIAMLLTNLPILMQHRRNGNWPKWLQKKSYFRASSLFFHAYQEALTDQPVPSNFVESIKDSQDIINKEQSDNLASRRKTKPAFSPRRRGGVFGFKK
jgi:poly(A) polymerase